MDIQNQWFLRRVFIYVSLCAYLKIYKCVKSDMVYMIMVLRDCMWGLYCWHLWVLQFNFKWLLKPVRVYETHLNLIFFCIYYCDGFYISILRHLMTTFIRHFEEVDNHLPFWYIYIYNCTDYDYMWVNTLSN